MAKTTHLTIIAALGVLVASVASAQTPICQHEGEHAELVAAINHKSVNEQAKVKADAVNACTARTPIAHTEQLTPMPPVLTSVVQTPPPPVKPKAVLKPLPPPIDTQPLTDTQIEYCQKVHDLLLSTDPSQRAEATASYKACKQLNFTPADSPK